MKRGTRPTASFETIVLVLVVAGLASAALAARPLQAQAASAPLAPVAAQVDLAALEPFDCRLEWLTSAPPGITCGYFTVPEDHGDPHNGRTLKLAVAVVHAWGPHRQPDAIVYLQGGPGGAAVASTPYLTAAYAQDLAERDLIVVDQRGVGQSQPNLGCPEVSTFARAALETARTDEEYADQYFAALQACLHRLVGEDVNLAAYTSAQSAADVVALGRALGYPAIDVYGISYGARLALTIVRDHGASGYVRSAVIGGIYGPEANALEFPLNLDRQLSALFETCEADAVCDAALPDLRARFAAYVQQLDAAPVEIEFADGERTYHTLANASIAYSRAFRALLSSSGIESLLPDLDAATRGDLKLLREGISAQIAELDSLAWGMNTAVQCQEEFLLLSEAERAAVVAQVPPLLRGWALRFPESSPRLPDFCRAVGLQPASPREAEPVRGDVPTLAVSGQFDPFTPPAWGARATAGLTRRYVYTVPGAGHDSVAANACTDEMVSAFLRDPWQAPDASCLAPE